MSHYNRIFIVGHSGAGKGVLAKALAEKLSWQYIDSDFGLAPSIGRSLSEILGKQGEEAFQQSLTDILTYQRTKENMVVTTDDSIVCSRKNRELLSEEFTVYLEVNTPIQLERISHNRPLLPSVDYKTFLDKLHLERDFLYKQVASLSVNSDSATIDNGILEKHVSTIIKAMEK